MLPDLKDDTTALTSEKYWFKPEEDEHFQRLLSFCVEWSGTPYLHLVDTFSASEAMAQIWRANGFCAETFDIKRGRKTHDLTSEGGTFCLADLYMSLVSGGLEMASPPGSLHVFMSSAVHKRSDTNTDGDTTNYKVRLANRIRINYVCVVRVVSMAKKMRNMIFWHITEQPSTSWQFKERDFVKLREEQQLGPPVFTHMGAFGHDLAKPSHLLGNMPTLGHLKRGKPKHMKTLEDKDEFYYESNGWICGGAKLAGAAAYTEKFAAAVHMAWLRAYNSPDMQAHHRLHRAGWFSGSSTD